MLLKRCFLLLTILWLLMPGMNAIAANLNDGVEIFNAYCVGCHIKGGNIVRRGKTLKQKALNRYGMDSLEAIQTLVTNGKLNMPAYGDRLTPEQIEQVAAYVLEQAAEGWR